MLMMMFKDADFNETRLPSQKYYDQYTGLELVPFGAAAARQAEIDFARRQKTFEPRPQAETYQRTGRKPFGMRWIDCNEGDEQGLELRSRLVVQETRQASQTSPPSFVLLPNGVNEGCGGEPLILQFLT